MTSSAPRLSLRRWTCALFCAVLLAAASASGASTVLYEKQSAYNDIVVTQEGPGLRALRFERGGALQSLVRLDAPGQPVLAYLRTVMLALALCEAPQRVLVVGLGGGTLPGFLHQRYPAARIDVVDIDPEVVHVAKTYFGFREDERMRAHVADGRSYIERARAAYDIIFLDAFGARSVPPHMTTLEFLGAVRRALRPGGLVAGNLWNSAYNPAYDAMARTYQEAFETVRIVPVAGTGNRILLALPRSEPVDTATLARRAGRVAAERQFGFDLAAEVLETPADEAAAIRAARVLRD